MKITVSERPQRITVERDGHTHTARWRQRGGNDGEFFEVQGSESILRAAMAAWSGQKEFDFTDEDLVKFGGGWWVPLRYLYHHQGPDPAAAALIWQPSQTSGLDPEQAGS